MGAKQEFRCAENCLQSLLQGHEVTLRQSGELKMVLTWTAVHICMETHLDVCKRLVMRRRGTCMALSS